MAVIKKKRLSWDPPADVDVVAHRLFVTEEGQPIDLDGAFVQVDMPQASVVLPDDFPDGTFAEDKNYTVGICAVDDVGNLGDIAMVTNPFDFVAPSVPTNLTVVDL